MENRKTIYKFIGVLLLIAALFVMLWQLFIIYSSGMRHVTHGLLLIAGVCVPLMLGTYFLTRSLAVVDHRRVVRASFFTLFVFYCAALVGALIISRVDYATFAETNAAYWNNFELMTNFHPFETVKLYINAIRFNYIGMEIPLSNLLGNALLFMPMAVFLPCLFRPMQKLWVFALTMLLMLVAVEAVQLLLACGSCDVDDILLNLSGTLILFGILKIPAIQRLLKRMYLLPQATEKTTAVKTGEETLPDEKIDSLEASADVETTPPVTE